jgi:hypothetical protein
MQSFLKSFTSSKINAQREQNVKKPGGILLNRIESYICTRMKALKRNVLRVSAGKWMSVALMFLCLTFLTSLNFFLYPAEKESKSAIVSTSGTQKNNNIPPAGPTEEKSSSSSVSIAEEILHEPHEIFNFTCLDYLYLHHIAEAEKIEMFHPEQLVPPPRS